ncbi:hypothetical protein J3E69DRAFT_320813 [Trichoderma sp. SZMC 28015]
MQSWIDLKMMLPVMRFQVVFFPSFFSVLFSFFLSCFLLLIRRLSHSCTLIHHHHFPSLLFGYLRLF